MFLTNAFGRGHYLPSLELWYSSWKLAYLHTLSKNPGILNGRRQKQQGPVERRVRDWVVRSGCANNVSKNSQQTHSVVLTQVNSLLLSPSWCPKVGGCYSVSPLNIWSANMPLGTRVRRGWGRKEAVVFPKVSSPLQYTTEGVRCSHHAI